MQFFNCIIQSILQFISLETKISMSKSLEFSDFKFQFWQNLTQPKATLDTLCRLLWSLVWPVQCGGKPAFRANTTKELRNMHKTVCSWGFVSLEQGTKEKQEFAIFRAS